MERLAPLGISIIVLIAVVVVPVLLSWVLDFYLEIRYGERKKEWYGKQGKLVGVIIVSWFFFIGIPAIEEVMFRGPILFFFSVLSPIVWMVIIAMSLVFGLVHVTKNWLNQSKVVLGGNENLSTGMKTWRFIATSTLGFILGYQAILHHSLYRCFWIHFFWNILAILILPFVIGFFLRLLEFVWFLICKRCSQRPY